MLAERLAHRPRVVEEDVDPDPRVRAGDARHVAQRAARRSHRVVPVDPVRSGLVDEQVRERVRQVARQRERAGRARPGRRRPGWRQATRRSRGRAGSAPDRSPRAGSGTTSRRRRAPRSHARPREPPSRRRDDRRRIGPCPAQPSGPHLGRADVRHRAALLAGLEHGCDLGRELRHRGRDDRQFCIRDCVGQRLRSGIYGAPLDSSVECLPFGVVADHLPEAGALGGKRQPTRRSGPCRPPPTAALPSGQAIPIEWRACRGTWLSEPSR